jgi:hypothetical protein
MSATNVTSCHSLVIGLIAIGSLELTGILINRRLPTAASAVSVHRAGTGGSAYQQRDVIVILNLVYDTAALNAPQSFRDGMQAAADMLDAHFIDNITVKH